MLRLFAKVFDGSDVTMSCVEYYQVRSLAIDSEGDDILDLDGEIKGAPPISLKVLPRAVEVFA
jgi:diacylglycerol kinase family enzyme